MIAWSLLALSWLVGPVTVVRAENAVSVLSDSNRFPIAVWLQDPANAPRFKAAGFNLYVGLWQGATEAQLATLKTAGMPVICEQNKVGLAHRQDPVIVGWMHGDEPDNAQALSNGKGYGPPIATEKVQADYQRMKAADPTRPVLLNLGQGVAWDHWYGRGVRSNRPEDYVAYAKAGDILSFDIYPAVHDHPECAGKLWLVPFGVERLRGWAGNSKIVWNCIEASRISNPQVKPTPRQIRAEVWMSLIHGSRGLIYFVHQFQPRFIEASLLADPELLAAVTGLNQQIQKLAPILNSTGETGTAETSTPGVPVDFMVKRTRDATYLFSVAMRDAETTATFTVRNVPRAAAVEVLGETRTIPIAGGKFADHFAGYAVHLYKIVP